MRILEIHRPQSALCFAVVLLCAFAAVLPRSLPAADLEEGWEYRWGDSPFEDGRPVWASPDRDRSDASAWQPIAFPSNPPDRNGRTNAWFRIRLPDRSESDNSLYIHSIDLIGEVYLDGERIYHFGQFEPDGTGRFRGWPWHLIDLPPDYPGKYLYFRIYSDYPDIGLWGEVKLAGEGSHLRKIIRRDLIPATVGFAFVLFGLLLIGLSLHRLRARLLLIGFFLINLGLIPIEESQIKQLFLFAPLAWQYIGAGNYFLLPVTMAALVQVLYGRTRWNIHQWVWQIHLVFFAYAMLCSLAGWINLSTTYFQFDLLACVTLLALAVSIQARALHGSTNQKLLAAGVWAMYLILLYNGLVAHGALPFTPSSEYLGPLCFGVCISIILLREYNALKRRLESHTRELEELNRTLEARVAERTLALQQSNQTKDQFFTIIAHDLKGPVGALAMLLHEFEKDGTGIPHDELSEMNQSAQETYRLLENLLDWARSQRGELVPRKTHFPICEAILPSLELPQRIAARRDIRLHYESANSNYVYADLAMITTVIRNLLGNAVKFCHPGGEVHISIEARPRELVVVCTDSGIGIDPARLAALFSPKNSPETTSGTNGERGSGLGLLLCKQFVEINGGRIEVESRPGKGSRFWFSVPTSAAP